MSDESDIKALAYIKNTNGGATIDNFHEDNDPIGHLLWNSLIRQELAYFEASDRIVRLTKKGARMLSASQPKKDMTT